jgi:hypothetical protein
MKDQRMSKLLRILPVLAGLFRVHVSPAATITDDFSTDPVQSGWRVYGNPSHFPWNSNTHNVEITWDSAQPNSYLFHPLGTLLSRSDDFKIEFDLLLKDIVSGNEPGKTGGLELGIGLLNLTKATNTTFMRGVFGGAPSLVEFDYFPPGFFEFGGTTYDLAATTTPTFISTNSSTYAPTLFAPYSFELPTNTLMHVTLAYAASNQTLVTILTTNGSTMFHPPDVVLTDTNSSAFTSTDDFLVDVFSINSYSSTGDDYDSVLAHGTIDNVSLVFPHPVENLMGAYSNGLWQVQFLSRSNWVYALERSTNVLSWATVSAFATGNSSSLSLTDTNPPPTSAVYRVRAARP